MNTAITSGLKLELSFQAFSHFPERCHDRSYGERVEDGWDHVLASSIALRSARPRKIVCVRVTKARSICYGSQPVLWSAHTGPGWLWLCFHLFMYLHVDYASLSSITVGKNRTGEFHDSSIRTMCSARSAAFPSTAPWLHQMCLALCRQIYLPWMAIALSYLISSMWSSHCRCFCCLPVFTVNGGQLHLPNISACWPIAAGITS